MPRQAKSTADEPFISNYPPLEQWLRKHEARCDWQVPVKRLLAKAYLEQWRFPNGRTVIIEVLPKKHGWSIWTEVHDHRIDETLEAAARHLGLR